MRKFGVSITYETVLLWLLSVVLILLIGGGTIFLIFALDRRPAVDALGIEFVDKVVTTGTNPSVQWKTRVRREGCGGRIWPRWIDSKGIVYLEPPEPIPFRLGIPSGDITYSRPRHVPDMNAGEAIFHPGAERWCNPVQEYLFPMAEDLPQAKIKVVRP